MRINEFLIELIKFCDLPLKLHMDLITILQANNWRSIWIIDQCLRIYEILKRLLALNISIKNGHILD
jgi:hypothetical protein